MPAAHLAIHAVPPCNDTGPTGIPLREHVEPVVHEVYLKSVLPPADVVDVDNHSMYIDSPPSLVLRMESTISLYTPPSPA